MTAVGSSSKSAPQIYGTSSEAGSKTASAGENSKTSATTDAVAHVAENGYFVTRELTTGEILAQREFAIMQNPDLVAQLAKDTVDTIKALALDNHLIMNGQNKKPLLKGFHYRVQYFAMLQARSKAENSLEGHATQLLKQMRDRNVFAYGKAPSAAFEQIQSTVSKVIKFIPECYRVKKGVKASVAMDDLWKNVTFIGCGEACQIAQATAIRRALGDGDAKFDALFGLNAKYRLIIGHGREQMSIFNPLSSLLTGSKITDVKQVKLGQMVNFDGAKGYGVKHLVGLEPTYNGVCIEAGVNPKFTTMGLDPEGATQAQIAQTLLDGFNETPVDYTEMLKPEIVKELLNQFDPILLRFHPLLKDQKMSREDFEKHGGGTFSEGTGNCFDIERIAILKKLPIDEAVKQLEEWQDHIVSFHNQAQAEAAKQKAASQTAAAPAFKAAAKK